jgi:transposase
MLTIGIDPHKRTHCAVAVDAVGRQVATKGVAVSQDGFGALVAWARGLDGGRERVWVLEDCRMFSGSLERFLLDHGEAVARLAPHLMAGARCGVRERGKSDPIDGLAVARAALREGVENLPVARLDGPELEVRLLATHRDRLVHIRTGLICELRAQCHDVWPEWEIPRRALIRPAWQTRVARRLAHAPRSARVQIARDLIGRIRDLTQMITALYAQLAELVTALAPRLLAEPGVGILIAAKLIGEIAGIDRFATDAKLARMAGCAPIPVSSGRTDRHRLDHGGNRQLNHAFHMLAICKLAHDDGQTAAYIANQRHAGKTNREALRCLKRQLVRRVFALLKHPNEVPITLCT